MTSRSQRARREWAARERDYQAQQASPANTGQPSAEAGPGRARVSKRGRGGTRGQRARATPSLPGYTLPPAGPVTITTRDGSTTTRPPHPPA